MGIIDDLRRIFGAEMVRREGGGTGRERRGEGEGVNCCMLLKD